MVSDGGRRARASKQYISHAGTNIWYFERFLLGEFHIFFSE
jgi:hypothetical protein